VANGSILNERLALSEYWSLQADPAFRGVNIPRGDGKLVLVLPGLFGNDFYLQPVRTWLSRIGYRPAMSMLRVNAGCPKRLLASVEESFAPGLARHSGDVAIIGHSRGGMLGKALITRLGDRVTQFVAVGSPVGAMLRLGRGGLQRFASGRTDDSDNVAHSSVIDAGRQAMRLLDPDCESPLCGCEYIDDLLAPFPAGVRVTAIYSTDDPVVSPDACPIDGGENIAVSGTHSGLMFNRAVYPHLARALV
jgi:pimeloyl-ACP methyl ester carboxylesterase